MTRRMLRASTPGARIAIVTLAAAFALICPATTRGQGQPRARLATTSRVALQIEGQPVGSVRSVDGGNPVAQVVTEPLGPDGAPKKHIANVSYDDIFVDAGFGATPLLDWAASSLGAQAPEKAGAITTLDFNYKGISERTFTGFVTALTVPRLDAASREAGRFTVRITPSRVVSKPAGGGGRPAMGEKEKQWLASNFRVELGNLPTSRVAAIDSFTIRRSISGAQMGAAREPMKQPGALDVPDLTLTISNADQAEWAKWAEDFLVQGRNTDGDEKAGAIIFLAPNLKEELGRISLDHCGLVSFDPASDETRFTVRLYCEKMSLVVPKS